jgi:hypothetical protein
MPLASGSSKATISSNVRELVRSARRKGKIGNVPVKSASKAREVASAIAYKKARESRAKGMASHYRAKGAVRRAKG